MSELRCRSVCPEASPVLQTQPLRSTRTNSFSLIKSHLTVILVLFTNNSVHSSSCSSPPHRHSSDKKINLLMFIFQVFVSSLCLMYVRPLIDELKPRSIIIHFQTSFFTFSLDGWTWCVWSLLPQRGGSRSSCVCVSCWLAVHLSVWWK